MYTAQQNRHGNVIVCKGNDVRNSYVIVFDGTYDECLEYKLSTRDDAIELILTKVARQLERLNKEVK